MQKIRIRMPATITNLGPGTNSLGLALSLYTTVEISPRGDETLNLEFQGEGAGRFGSPLRHPVVLGMSRFFQSLERALLGLNIRVDNQIPLGSGLGAEAAFMAAGALAANDLMGFPYTRPDLLAHMASVNRADHAVTALSGGLTASLYDGQHVTHKTLPIAPLTVVVVVPELEHYIRSPIPEQVPLRDALQNIARVSLLTSALHDGDLDLIAQVVEDRLLHPHLAANITGYEYVVEMAQRAGARAVTISGNGPALVAFAETGHQRIADEMRLAFHSSGVAARTWVLPVDTQGVVISAMQSA